MLDLNTIRAEFAEFLAQDPTKWRLDAALAHVVERAYKAGHRDAAAQTLSGTEPVLITPLDRLPAIGRWRRADERPKNNTTAVIAVIDDAGDWILHRDLHHYHRGRWRDEAHDDPLDHAEFLWLPEAELLAGLEAPA